MFFSNKRDSKRNKTAKEIKESKIQARQTRLEELDQYYKAAKDALRLEQVRGQIVNLNNRLKQMERFWNKEASEVGGEDIKEIAVFNSAKEAVINIVSNYSVIDWKPFYEKIVENLSRLVPQFDIKDVEYLGELISSGECVIAEDERRRKQMIDELSKRLTGALMKMLSLGKIADAIACVDEIQSMVETTQRANLKK